MKCPHCGEYVFRDQLVEWGGWTLDKSQLTLQGAGGQAFQIPRGRYMDLLETLIRAHGRYLTKTQLIEMVWPPHYIPAEEAKSVEVLVCSVRKLLRQHGFPRAIATIYKIGYQLREARHAT